MKPHFEPAGPFEEEPTGNLENFGMRLRAGRITMVDPYVGFKKLEGEIAAKGKARDPGAVAAAIGRKKYGAKRFQAAAAAGRKMGP